MSIEGASALVTGGASGLDAATVPFAPTDLTNEAQVRVAVAMTVKIAARAAFGLRLAKESVNRPLDSQGHSVLLESELSLHNLGHASDPARARGRWSPRRRTRSPVSPAPCARWVSGTGAGWACTRSTATATASTS